MFELSRREVNKKLDRLLTLPELNPALVTVLRKVVHDLREDNTHVTQYEYLLIILLENNATKRPLPISEMTVVIKETSNSKKKKSQKAMEQAVRNLIGRLEDKIQVYDPDLEIFPVSSYALGRRARDIN